jgi:porphobilinogen deaminase
MQAIVTSPDGARIVRRSLRGPAGSPVEVGRRLAEELASGGALEILNSLR